MLNLFAVNSNHVLWKLWIRYAVKLELLEFERQKKKKNVIGEKCIKDGKDNLTFVVADRLKVWK